MGDTICFADFEFTCGFYNQNVRSELLSVGLVFCDKDYNILSEFYSTIRPCRNYKLTKKCRDLTHLTQAEISSSADANEVMRKAVNLMRRHGADSLYVWGNFDIPGLKNDIEQHNRSGRPAGNITKICESIRDIQNELTKEMQLPQAVSIEELSAVFGYEPEVGTFHNALNDAEALYCIHKAVKTTDIFSSPTFVQLRQDRIDKLEAVKKAAEERRVQQAFSVELSEEEKAYLSAAESLSADKAKREFIAMRSRIVGMMKKYPKEDDFVLVMFSEPKYYKIYPEGVLDKKFPWSRIADQVRFPRNNIGKAVLHFCPKLGNAGK